MSWEFKPRGIENDVSSNFAPLPDNILRGVALIIAAALTISIQDVVFKLFSSELTLWQIFALRGMLAIPMLLVLLIVRGVHREVIRVAFGKWSLLRGMFITTTFLAFYAAIPFLSISTVGAANYIAPILVVLLSAYVIKEPVRPLGWLGVLVGFAGVIILLQPGTDAFSAWLILPIVGAAFYALAHVTTRVKCRNTPLAALSLSQNFIMMSAGIIVSILLVWLKPESALFKEYPYIFGRWLDVGLTDWFVLLTLAGFTIAISVLLAGAYQTAAPAVISTFEYSYLVFVSIWDILFFGTPPTFASVTGMVLIVVAGLLVLHRK